MFGAGNYAVTSPPALIVDPGSLVLNGAFDGSGDTAILAAGSGLAASESWGQIPGLYLVGIEQTSWAAT